MKKLLIIDSSRWTLDSLTKAINWPEVDVEVMGACQSTSEACEILSNSLVDIVLVDINMLGMDNLNLIDYISSKYPHIKLVAMSSNKELEFIYKSIYPHLQGFILKPIILDELVKVFSQLYVYEKMTNISAENFEPEVPVTIPTKQISTQAKEYINRNISIKGLNLKTTSDALHVGYHYLSKRFTEQEGITFIEYITARRLDVACTLLTTTSLHIYEICEQIGLEPKNFHRLFRNKFGISPQKYRTIHSTK